TFRGHHVPFQVASELTQHLQRLSRQSGTTLFMTLLASYATLLFRYTGQEDMVIGSPIANRNHQEIEELIGVFINNLPLRFDFAGNPSFSQLLAQVRRVTLAAYAHQDMPFECLVENLAPKRDLSHSPVFQTMFALQNAPAAQLELSELVLTILPPDVSVS